MSDVEIVRKAVQAATEATLRTVAEWGDMCTPDELQLVADQVALDPAEWWCCPVCEEVECDDGCPLAPIRNADL